MGSEAHGVTCIEGRVAIHPREGNRITRFFYLQIPEAGVRSQGKGGPLSEIMSEQGGRGRGSKLPVLLRGLRRWFLD